MHVNPTTKTHGSKKQYHNGSIGWAVHGLLQRLQRLILFKQLFERQKSQNHKLYKISLCHNVTRLHKGVMSLGQQDSGFLSQAQCIFHPQRFHLLPPLIPLLLTWLLPPTMPLVLSLLGSWQRRCHTDSFPVGSIWHFGLKVTGLLQKYIPLVPPTPSLWWPSYPSNTSVVSTQSTQIKVCCPTEPERHFLVMWRSPS